MGKGFNNYMTKKFFHPGSKDNIKRVWMAQQKTAHEKKKQEDMLNQYMKEQDMYNNRALLGDEKAKLGLSFMYDPPPGLKKDKEGNEPEQEFKFEWQRKYNAPRESYAKGNDEILDQPFGIEVRNVRCIKCRQWGHVNTDKICPLFSRNLTAEPELPAATSTSQLMEGMKKDGYLLKQSVLGKKVDGSAKIHQIVDEDGDSDDPEVQFLKSLNPKQKKKLLKKLSRLQNKKKKSKKSGKSKKVRSDNDSAESSDDDKSRSKARKKSKKNHETSSSENDRNEQDNTNKRVIEKRVVEKFNVGNNFDIRVRKDRDDVPGGQEMDRDNKRRGRNDDGNRYMKDKRRSHSQERHRVRNNSGEMGSGKNKQRDDSGERGYDRNKRRSESGGNRGDENRRRNDGSLNRREGRQHDSKADNEDYSDKNRLRNDSKEDRYVKNRHRSNSKDCYDEYSSNKNRCSNSEENRYNKNTRSNSEEYRYDKNRQRSNSNENRDDKNRRRSISNENRYDKNRRRSISNENRDDKNRHTNIHVSDRVENRLKNRHKKKDERKNRSEDRHENIDYREGSDERRQRKGGQNYDIKIVKETRDGRRTRCDSSDERTSRRNSDGMRSVKLRRRHDSSD